MAGPWLHTTSGAGNLSAVLGLLFQNELVSNIERSCPYLQLVPVKNATPGAQSVTWPVAFSDSSYTNGAVADGADVTVYNHDVTTYATLHFTTYMEACAVGGRAQAIAANVNNPTALGDLIGSELAAASNRLARVIGAAVYTGTGASNQIQGLYSTTGTTYGALNSSGTYAGVDRSTYTEFVATVESNGSVARALTTDLMRKTLRQIVVASGEKPNLIVTDPVTHEYYGKTFGSDRRYVQDVRISGQPIALDGGYNVLLFDGIPVVEDPNHPAGKMSFLNTRYCEIQQVPFKMSLYDTNSIGTTALQGTPYLNTSGRTGLMCKIKHLAEAGDAIKLEILLYLQNVVRKPSACGALVDLLTA